MGGKTEDVRSQAAARCADARLLHARSALLLQRTRELTDRAVEVLLAAGDGGAPLEEFHLRAGRLPSAVALVRGRLRPWLESSGVDPSDALDITLAVSEACANAIEHPVEPRRHAFEVDARRTAEGIELAVRDFGAWRSDAPASARGRGLQMIRRLMDAAEIVTGADETTIVMRRAWRRPDA